MPVRRRTERRGLSKMRIQCLLIAAVINFKRLITLLTAPNRLPQAILDAIYALWRNLIAIAQFEQSTSLSQDRRCKTTLVLA